MNVNYLISIPNPNNHLLKVEMKGVFTPEQLERKKLVLFLPSWSPGSYFMREYSKNIRWLKFTAPNGEIIYHQQIAKGRYEIDLEKSKLNQTPTAFHLEYEIYCHEVSVRTSYIDHSHAFIHGPSVFMGVEGEEIKSPTLEVKLNPLWSKISTGLKDVSPQREIFLYQAENYDELIDTPLEIGCHETDGFRVAEKDHELAFYGTTFVHPNDLKKDIKIIVEYISALMGEMPYEKYTFITHFLPNKYGGLEHLNSTALMYNGLKLSDRKTYLHWLGLVAHEYFHTWNVKRIRPKELGPFDYTNENYTKMLWLAEGLTSFMDDLFVYRSGLCTLEEYLETIKSGYQRYFDTPGRRFHSLEDSSFNAWIKLYRPDENSQNSSISYYNKGAIAFFVLNSLLAKKGRTIDEFVKLLWSAYKSRPEVGLENHEVYTLIEDLGGPEVKDIFEDMITTTKEIDLETHFQNIGLSLSWEESNDPWLGIQNEIKDNSIFIKSVVLDGPAYKYGLNAGDEIVAVNGVRMKNSNWQEFSKIFSTDKEYSFLIARNNCLVECPVILGRTPKKLKEIAILNKEQATKSLLGK